MMACIGIIKWMFMLYIATINQMPSAAARSAVMTSETDGLSLLAFKNEVIDPNHRLSSWNASLHLCLWPGVTCGRKHQRVTELSLPSGGLVGTLSPHLGNLTFLRRIHLENNGFHGGIPPELGRLSRLQYLGLFSNSLEGQIPANLSNCYQLAVILLRRNELEGGIPAQLGSLPRLDVFDVQLNYHLGGSIPPSLGNISSLTVLALGGAGLTGTIPHQLSQLSKLVYFGLFLNQLHGDIPSSIYTNLSLVQTLVFSSNNLSGTLPADMGTNLPHLRIFAAYSNYHLTGHIPLSLCNASQLAHFDIQDNSYFGPIPADIGKQGSLLRLRLGNNQFGGAQGGGDDLQFITSLINCTSFYLLDGFDNNFHGLLPHSIVNFSTSLKSLILSENKIYGTIPPGVEALSNLEILALENNLLSGSIPSRIGELANFTVLALTNNKLTEPIPSSLGNLTRLVHLRLSGNLFHGSVLPSLANCLNLEFFMIASNGLVGSIPPIIANSAMLRILDLSNNSLTHPIPSELFSLSSLDEINLSHNMIAGPLPPGIDRLVNIRRLVLSNNQLNGRIPEALGVCLTLEFLYIQANAFEGTLPTSLSKLKSLRAIDVSHNRLGGPIGEIFTNLDYLEQLNLSYNDFEGNIPIHGVFTNLTAISLEGNTKLCGGISELHFPPCKKYRGKNGEHFKVLIIALFAGAIIIVLVLCRIFILQNRSVRTAISSTDINMRLPTISSLSYGDIIKATNNFSSSNVIGTGNFSVVYRGVLEPDSTVVAVKVFNLEQIGASKSFLSECLALKNIRHRNLVKILTCCSGYDYRDKEFKALVYELMENGTLESWLHQESEEDSHHFRKKLSLRVRLEIAIDIARALDYLHNNSHTPIVHCDLKPTNILLNKNMVAHVSDFGLAKILLPTNSDSSSHFTSTGRLKGTIGYIPPEYGTSSFVTTQGDIFSYGVILLEMLIGKKPTHEMFQQGLTITSYAKRAFPDRVMEIVDEQLLTFVLREDISRPVSDCIISIMQVGIECSSDIPNDRMNMVTVISKLELVRKMLPGEDEI